MRKSYEMDMTRGPLLRSILIFTLPLLLSGVLQLLYNATDIVVVGQFAGANAMASVGSTTSLFNLLINAFIGISVGANVLVARYCGEKNYDGVQQTVQTSLLTGLVGGVILVVLGIVLARPMLTLMKTPDEVIEGAVLYMRVYFIGMPATMIYNFGAVAVAGNTAAANVEGFVYISMNSLYQTTLSFTSQNLGAKQYRRVDGILVRCMILVILIGVVLGQGAYRLGDPLLHIYSQDPEVIAYGIQRFSVVSVTYFLCGMMDVGSGVVRGLGYSIMPMLVSMVGACVFRVIWIFTVFRMYHTLFTLYVSYPISWVLTVIAHMICYLIVRRRMFPKKQ